MSDFIEECRFARWARRPSSGTHRRRHQRHHHRVGTSSGQSVVHGQSAADSRPVRLPLGPDQATTTYERVKYAIHRERRRTGVAQPSLVFRRLSASAATTTANPAATRRFRGPTSRTSSSASSTGGCHPPSISCRAFTPNGGSIGSSDLREAFEATQRLHASVPAMTFGDLTRAVVAHHVEPSA